MKEKKDINMKSDMVRQGIGLEKEAQKLFDYNCPKCNSNLKVHEGDNKCPTCGQKIEFIIKLD